LSFLEGIIIANPDLLNIGSEETGKKKTRFLVGKKATRGGVCSPTHKKTLRS
jgi:hypothetical protein